MHDLDYEPVTTTELVAMIAMAVISILVWPVYRVWTWVFR